MYEKTTQTEDVAATLAPQGASAGGAESPAAEAGRGLGSAADSHAGAQPGLDGGKTLSAAAEGLFKKERRGSQLDHLVPSHGLREKLMVKYNGEARELSPEEAVTLAQKGLNYDHVKAELELLRQKVGQNHSGLASAEAKGENLIAPAPASAAPALSSNQAPDSKTAATGDTADILSESAGGARDKMFDDFARLCPGVKFNEVPNDVWNKVLKDGEDLTSAFLADRLRRTEQQLKTLEHNLKIRSKSVGSARGDFAAADYDPFLAGLLSP